MQVYSRSVSFFSWWRVVGDRDDPITVWCQYEHTEASMVKARCSDLTKLPGMKRTRSASVSRSFRYSSNNVRTSTLSNISSGRSTSFYSKNITTSYWLFWAYTLCSEKKHPLVFSCIIRSFTTASAKTNHAKLIPDRRLPTVKKSSWLFIASFTKQWFIVT